MNLYNIRIERRKKTILSDKSNAFKECAFLAICKFWYKEKNK